MSDRKFKCGSALVLLLLCVPGLLCSQHFGDLYSLARGKTDKADTHGFTEIYEHMFYPLKSSPIRICEIGIAWGGSLDVWSRYFSRATVFGIDDHSLDELRSMMRAQ